MKLSGLGVAIGALALGLATPALAENKVRIISGYALTFLPNYIVQEHELIQKHAARLGLQDVMVEFSRSPSVAVANERLITNNVDKWVTDHPKELAAIYVKYEPQKDGPDFVERLITEKTSFSFTTTPKGAKLFADHMHKSGLLSKSDWKDEFFYNVADKPGS